MKNEFINEQGIKDIDRLAGEVLEGGVHAGAVKLGRVCEDGVTEMTVIVCTSELARVAQLAIQKHLEDQDHIVFDNAVE